MIGSHRRHINRIPTRGGGRASICVCVCMLPLLKISVQHATLVIPICEGGLIVHMGKLVKVISNFLYVMKFASSKHLGHIVHLGMFSYYS